MPLDRFEPAPLDEAFTDLVREARACRRCPRMEGRRRVLGPANGPLGARLLFVAEAPGRLGADVSGIPLTGDRSGETFEQLLAAAGLHRADVFITNAVLCNPRDANGRNARPSWNEIANCNDYLGRLIHLLQPVVVASLGVTALEALARLAAHGAVLRRHVAQPLPWFGRWLVPLYHPGPRALIRRPLALQQADYAQLAALVVTLAERAPPLR